jgi:hypothetical protein
MTRAAPRRRIHPYVSAPLRDRLTRYCAAAASTESAVVEAALHEYLGETGDRTLLFRRLDRLGRALARAERDRELHAEAFAVFVKLWFAHTPSVPADARKAAQSTAEHRYAQYVDFIASQFSGGHRFLDDLPREVLGEEGELSNVREDRRTAQHEPTRPDEGRKA